MTQNSVLDKLDKLDRLEKGNGKIISFQNGPLPIQLVVVMAVRAAVMEDPLPSSPFMGRSLGYAHAGGDAQGGKDGGEDGDDGLRMMYFQVSLFMAK